MNIFLIQNQSQTGPHTVDEVRSLIASGEITAASPAWYPGLGDWITVAELPEAKNIFAHFQQQSTPSPRLEESQQQSTQARPSSAPARSGLAIASMITGIASILGWALTAIPAIIMGHIARRRIKNSDGHLQGSGMALTGLICGYFFLIASTLLLVGAIPAGMSAAKEAAHRTAAKNDVTQIVTAIKSFYTDYGVYPIPQSETTPGGSTFGDGTFDNKRILDVLRNVDPSDQLNTRHVTYIDLPPARDAGTPVSGIGSDGNFYDPWGHQYIIRVDSAYSGVINDPDHQQLQTGVIAWSLGPDGKAMICSWK